MIKIEQEIHEIAHALFFAQDKIVAIISEIEKQKKQPKKAVKKAVKKQVKKVTKK